MTIKDLLKEKNMTMYQLSKKSGIPYSTIHDICTGKTDLMNCTLGTAQLISLYLGISIDELVTTLAITTYRSNFETFKSNVCHSVKDMGDLDFIINTLESDSIRELYNKKWYLEALYLLAMLDYISRVNHVPLSTRYDDIRKAKLESPVYSLGVSLTSRILNSDKTLIEAEKKAIPEFKRFNIMESEVRNVI